MLIFHIAHFSAHVNFQHVTGASYIMDAKQLRRLDSTKTFAGISNWPTVTVTATDYFHGYISQFISLQLDRDHLIILTRTS